MPSVRPNEKIEVVPLHFQGQLATYLITRRGRKWVYLIRTSDFLSHRFYGVKVPISFIENVNPCQMQKDTFKRLRAAIRVFNRRNGRE